MKIIKTAGVVIIMLIEITTLTVPFKKSGARRQTMPRPTGVLGLYYFLRIRKVNRSLYIFISRT